MGIALLVSMVVITISGSAFILMLLLSDQANAETKAGILSLLVLQVVGKLYDQFKSNQADEQRLRMEIKLEEVKQNSDEAVGSARSVMASYIKSDDLHELDELADGFAKKLLDLPQSIRFLELLNTRMEDDLTRTQKDAVRRAIEILHHDIANPQTKEKSPAIQTAEEMATSKEKQAGHEVQQREDGTRKDKVTMEQDTPPVTEATKTALASPRAVEAASQAAASAAETQRLTERTQQIVGQETRKAERNDPTVPIQKEPKKPA